jgi:hypothetical protein
MENEWILVHRGDFSDMYRYFIKRANLHINKQDEKIIYAGTWDECVARGKSFGRVSCWWEGRFVLIEDHDQ